MRMQTGNPATNVFAIPKSRSCIARFSQSKVMSVATAGARSASATVISNIFCRNMPLLRGRSTMKTFLRHVFGSAGRRRHCIAGTQRPMRSMVRRLSRRSRPTASVASNTPSAVPSCHPMKAMGLLRTCETFWCWMAQRCDHAGQKCFRACSTSTFLQQRQSRNSYPCGMDSDRATRTEGMQALVTSWRDLPISA